LERLQALEARAKADEKGLWKSDLKRIENVNELADPKAFAETWKGKPLEGKSYIFRLGKLRTNAFQPLSNVYSAAIDSFVGFSLHPLSTCKL